MVPTSRYPVSTFLTLTGINTRKTLAAITALLFAVTCMAQDQTQPQPSSSPNPSGGAQTHASPQSSTVTLSAGTRINLVLMHDIQSRSMRRGDDIYAQVTSPVNSDSQVMIPPGTFVQGTVDKLQQKTTLESDEGYALRDPGPRRTIGFVALPAAGVGLGALIGHSVVSSQNTTLTNTLPPWLHWTTTRMPFVQRKRSSQPG